MIILLAHSAFSKMSPHEGRSLMKHNPVLIDVQGMVDLDAAETEGMVYRKL